MNGEVIVLLRNMTNPTYQSSTEVELFSDIIIMAMIVEYKILQ